MIKKIKDHSFSIVNSSTKDAINILGRLRRRDFSGNTGLAIKNTVYQTSTTLVSKIGSLLFTMVIARMLLPELFGLYSLALSTIILISTFADLGIGTSLIRYIAKKRNIKDAGPYVFYLRKLKITLLIAVSIVLILLARIIANNYYQKPIFFALLFGGLYIMSNGFLGFINGVFQAENNFRYPLFKEIFFQITRLILVPLTILFTLKYSSEVLIASIIISLSICYSLSSLFLYSNMGKYKNGELSKEKKKEVIKFTLPLTLTVLSGVFFGYIDIIMLGRFVSSEYIAYYQAALALLSSGIAITSFSEAIFPVFSKLKGKRLERGLRRSRAISIILSFFSVIATLLIAPFIVNLIYGVNYTQSAQILRVLSLIIIIDPLIGLYSSYFISKGRNILLAKVVLLVTSINIFLNYILIISLIKYGVMFAVLGVSVATVFSRVIYLWILFIKSKS